MKRNAFGEAILQDEDDIAATFSETYGTEGPFIVREPDISDDPNFAWSCVVTDEDLNEIQVQDFDNRAALIAFLTAQGVEIQ